MEKYSIKVNKQHFWARNTLSKRKCSKFYHKIAKGWSKLTQEPITANSALMQQVWYNKSIIVNKKTIQKVFLCQLFIADLYHQNKLKDWQNFEEKLNLTQKDYFRWKQIVAAIPKSWKKSQNLKDAVHHPNN